MGTFFASRFCSLAFQWRSTCLTYWFRLLRELALVLRSDFCFHQDLRFEQFGFDRAGAPPQPPELISAPVLAMGPASYSSSLFVLGALRTAGVEKLILKISLECLRPGL